MSQKPDFRAFEDWRVDDLACVQLGFYDQDTKLTVAQKKVVEKNAKLLLDRDKWSAHVQAFEEQLALIKNEEERSQTRARYQIRFDHHTFPDHKANFFGFHFPCSVSFSGATFGKGSVMFSRATFGDGTVSFSGTTFGERVVRFHGAIFGDGDVWFS
ncbi:MAG: pentapeptide repeat-containing protein, partial [Hyphomicrobiales bacterium]